MPNVFFNYADVKAGSVKSKVQIKKFVSFIGESEGKSISSINYVFCTDTFLLDINKSFLKHDFFTDVITFDLSETDEIVAEIYVSVDRVKENASVIGVPYDQELLRVIFHGILHLCGYKDKKKSEITIMRRKEDYYLQLYNQKYTS